MNLPWRLQKSPETCDLWKLCASIVNKEKFWTGRLHMVHKYFLGFLCKKRQFPCNSVYSGTPFSRSYIVVITGCMEDSLWSKENINDMVQQTSLGLLCLGVWLSSSLRDRLSTLERGHRIRESLTMANFPVFLVKNVSSSCSSREYPSVSRHLSRVDLISFQELFY